MHAIVTILRIMDVNQNSFIPWKRQQYHTSITHEVTKKGANFVHDTANTLPFLVGTRHDGWPDIITWIWVLGMPPIHQYALGNGF